jgi:2',3'-cyclic-nucleotide 2'-phosphodiesterase (5'-nucleotidase family)
VSVHIGNAPLDESRSYTIVVNDFEYTGGSGLGFGSAATRAENLDLVDLDAFVDYLVRLPQPVVPPTDKRFVVVSHP